MNRRTKLAGSLFAAALLAAGCTGSGGTSKGADAKAPDDPAKVTGTITVLTHRTDLVHGRHDEEVRRRVQQDLSEGQGQVRGPHGLRGRGQDPDEHRGLRRRADDPRGHQEDRLPEVLRLARHQAERAKKYLFTDYTTVDGKVYGQSPIGALPGFLYNKRVWKEAGITDWPTTPAEFIDGLKASRPRPTRSRTTPTTRTGGR